VRVFCLLSLLALVAPTADGDGDGIPDGTDKCPADAETPNGYQDADGCPDLAPRPPASANDVGKIVERIAFAHDSAELKPSSFPMLDALAVVIKMQPQQFPMVALEGHAADNERAPMKLSLARSSAVRIALVARGVDAGRLLARASGTTAPVCSQPNESCRARERTVEFATLATPKATATEEAEGEPREPEGERPQAQKEPPAERAAAASIPLERIDFKKGSAHMGPSSLANLDILAGFMKSTPVSLEIVGSADDEERKPSTLARARAEAVRAYMIACGVSSKHLITRSERASPKSCRGHSDSCRARWRRAELRFIEPGAP
jgi:outer membrane protein OmpA-like peptidoglycan-associated protein